MSTVTAPQKNVPVTEHEVPKRIKRTPCATYPTPPPSPDDYCDDDPDVDQLGPEFPTKWEHWDEDSYGSLCPKDKKYSCKRPPSIEEERKFLRYFSETPNTVPFWVMLKIRVDLRQEHTLLVRARRTADMRRLAKQGQHSFVARDSSRREKLETIIRLWKTKAQAEEDKGLIPMTLSALSQKDQDYYNEQREHYQKIADAYTKWYDRCREISQGRNDTYFYCDPWEVDFELPSSALESPLDGFLNESWLPGSTCVDATARDPLEEFLPSPRDHRGYGTKINECHHLDTILLPPIESYHASAPVLQVLATESKKHLSCTVATCKTIGNRTSNKILKVLFDSGSTKTMIHRSALPKGYQCISTLPPLRFQTLGGKTTSTTAVQLNNLSFPEFNGNISIDSQTAYSFDQDCRYDIIFGANFLDKFGFTINYNDNLLQWMDH